MRTAAGQKFADVFLNARVYSYGTPKYFLRDNGPQFVANLLQAVCGMLSITHLLTTTYHPQTNGLAERFSRTLVTRLRHYVSARQTSWSEIVQLLTYAFKIQVHQSTSKTPLTSC